MPTFLPTEMATDPSSPSSSSVSPSSSSSPPASPDYVAVMRHARSCHEDEDCTYPLCFQMKLSMLHLTNCRHKNCREISCKALAASPLRNSSPRSSTVPMRDKIKRAIVLSDMIDVSRKTERAVGIKKPIPVYANEVHNVNLLKNVSKAAPKPVVRLVEPTEKEAVEFFARAYVDIFARIARAGKG